MNPRTAKTGLLILTAIIIGVVVIFFRKPREQDTATKIDSSQSLVLRRDVVESPSKAPKVASPITAATEPSESPVGAADANPFPDPNAADTRLAVPELEPIDVGPIADPIIGSTAADNASPFVRPSVSVLPPETPHGEPPVLEKLVDVPPLPTASTVERTVRADAVKVGQEAYAVEKTMPLNRREVKQMVLKHVGPPRYHRIVDGDTLENISMHYFGTESRAKDLFEMNRSLLDRPDLLPLRRHLLIPPETHEYVVNQRESGSAVTDEQGSRTLRESQPTPATTPMPEAVLSPIPDQARDNIQSHPNLVPVP